MRQKGDITGLLKQSKNIYISKKKISPKWTNKLAIKKKNPRLLFLAIRLCPIKINERAKYHLIKLIDFGPVHTTINGTSI